MIRILLVPTLLAAGLHGPVSLAQETGDPPATEALETAEDVEEDIEEIEEPAEPEEPKVLTVDDYGRWNSVGSQRISNDGSWAAYTIRPNEGDGRLIARRTHGDATEEGATHEIDRGASPSFSSDSAHFVCTVSPKSKEGGGSTPGSRQVLWIQLADGERRTFENAESARFAEGSSHFVVRKSRPKGGEDNGADLLVVDAANGNVRNVGNVGSYAFDESGCHLAYTVSARDRAGNGVYLLRLSDGLVQLLDGAEADYSRLAFDGEGDTHLVVLRGKEVEGKTRKANDLLVFADVGTAAFRRIEYCPSADETFPEGMVLSELSGPRFSKDRERVFFGLKEQEDKPEKKGKKGKKDDRANVDVWHWEDDRVQSIQARRAGSDRNFTWQVVLHLEDKRLVRLADDSLRRVRVQGGGTVAIGSDSRSYAREVTWGGSRSDVYRVDLGTGERRLITRALGRPLGTSPDGVWYLFLKAGDVWSYHLESGKARNLSSGTPVRFVNESDDHPYEKPTYGIAAWASDGEHVVLNHEFDLYRVALDGSSVSNLTQGVGEKEQVHFRYLRLDPELDTLDLSEPFLLTATGEWNKKSGFFLLPPGGKPSVLAFDDVRYGRPQKAKDADEVLLTAETFERYGDVHLSDVSFESFSKLSDANPQQSEYLWGRRVLVDYENSKGQRLQATLTLPAGYEEGKTYPMLVYFYEKMSSRHHSYSQPRFDDRPHMSTYASDGYLVLMPDVVYETGRPGDSAVDCVTSAVREVIRLGYADRERVGLQGHSWGGYQSSFILTQTDLFCAVVTGAPVTNLVSFYNELYKSSGSVQQGIVERGQVRMGTTPWENMELYHSQSPVHNVQNITTPFVILHGTDDGAVDWHQGLEFYNSARRHGKEAILLSYPGEGHHLANRANQIDFQIRMKQFFDHYCKGTAPAEWMTEGVPYLMRDKATPRAPEEDDTDKEGWR